MYAKHLAFKKKARQQIFNIWDLLAIILVVWFFIMLSNSMSYMRSPLPESLGTPLSLDPKHLPEYIFRSIIRVLIALFASIIFSIIYALIAAKNKYLQKAMISLLDILQSIPILGYLSFTMTGFIALAPTTMLGIEMAVIFTVFTCQVWNITYSIYQSIITIPESIKNTDAVFKLNPVQRFLLIELPYAIPPLVWNIMISVSASWFFVVASEAIIEGNNNFYLPGIGAYIASAIDAQNLNAIFYAIGALTIVILLYDRLCFRPLVNWSEKFKYDLNQQPTILHNSWNEKLAKRSRVAHFLWYPVKKIQTYLLSHRFGTVNNTRAAMEPKPSKYEWLKRIMWFMAITSGTCYAFYKIAIFLYYTVTFDEIKHTLYLGFITTIRILVIMVLTTIFWLPISLYIGFSPKLAKIVQPLALMLASFPANILFPLCVYLIQRYNLNPDIWLSVLFILSIQWYLVFNIISGATMFPQNLREIVKSFDIKGVKLMCKVIVPAILPYFLVGAITAWGSAWNATIIAEFAKWGETTLEATGIGQYVTVASNAGNMPKIVLGILVMLLYIEIFNRLFWRPIFRYAESLEQLK
jgi:NitT/TauT family transport system permease protein